MHIYSEEDIPRNMTVNWGRSVVTNDFVNTYHSNNKDNRRPHSRYIIFLDCAPIMGYTKPQNTVEYSLF